MKAKHRAIVGAVTLGLTTYAMAKNSRRNLSRTAKKVRKSMMDMF